MISRVALEIGYAPDEIANALTACRLPRSGYTKQFRKICYITSVTSQEEFDARDYHREFYEGALESANRHGYQCDLKSLRDFQNAECSQGSAETDASYCGLILGAIESDTARPRIDWDRYSVVKIDSHASGPSVCSVSSDQMHNVQLAYRKLRELGYRRVGMAIGEADEESLLGLYTAGFLTELLSVPEKERVPPLYFDYHAMSSEAIPQLRNWIQQHRVDAVMGNWYTFREMVTVAGFNIPEDLACASLDLPKSATGWAGVIQDHHAVGNKAADELVRLIRSGQKGPSPTPSSTFVPGSWHSDSSAPARF